jgi:hypothetical protein
MYAYTEVTCLEVAVPTEVTCPDVTCPEVTGPTEVTRTDVTHTDVTKAFDYVNHNVLLSKLEFYGITGRANKLIKSYLSDRYQRVIIKNNCANKCFSE